METHRNFKFLVQERVRTKVLMNKLQRIYIFGFMYDQSSPEKQVPEAIKWFSRLKFICPFICLKSSVRFCLCMLCLVFVQLIKARIERENFIISFTKCQITTGNIIMVEDNSQILAKANVLWEQHVFCSQIQWVASPSFYRTFSTRTRRNLMQLWRNKETIIWNSVQYMYIPVQSLKTQPSIISVFQRFST